tara:strand:+ start:1368 stop:1580 length:213 start_codon:yes stop_codon:yes gene_type:complete
VREITIKHTAFYDLQGSKKVCLLREGMKLEVIKETEKGDLICLNKGDLVLEGGWNENIGLSNIIVPNSCL